MEPSTILISSSRNEIIPFGGYGQYRRFCAQKLLHIRRKLKIVTPKGRRFEKSKTDNISAEDYGGCPEWREYLIFSAERAWAHAMDTKSLNAVDSGEIALHGSLRSHVLSRLAKASKAAAQLVRLSEQQASSDENTRLLLAHGAYWRLIEGTAAFEAQKWDASIRSFAEAHVLYTALSEKGSGNLYQDLINDNVEPSIRYAAYRLKLPRTTALPKVVAQYVSRDSDLVKKALQLSPGAINDGQASSQKDSDTDKDLREAPDEIRWRGRTVKLEDARIAQALGAAKRAEKTLEAKYKARGNVSAAERAAAFEDILGRSQDAADAAKAALEELAAEGVSTAAQNMQNLQITRTAVTYDTIGWRVGRNRVLCGKRDGIEVEDEQSDRKTKSEKLKLANNSTGKYLAHLRSQVVLYDTTLDSLNSINELPGVAADQDLTKKVASRKAYFSALRTLAIARSHATLGNTKNCLALLNKASEAIASISITDDNEPGAKSPIPQHFLTTEEARYAQRTIEGLKVQYQALVELDQLQDAAVKAEKAKAAWSAPLIERLDEYPPGGADLKNLVSYPPKLRPVPVNPIFLDVAWNYIDYPGQEKTRQHVMDTVEVATEQKPAKRGWFGF